MTTSVDRESAHEILQKRTRERAKLAAEMEAAEEKAKGKAKTAKKSGGSRGDSFWTALGKTVVRTVRAHGDAGARGCDPAECAGRSLAAALSATVFVRQVVAFAATVLSRRAMFTLDSITLRLGGHVILERATVAVPPKARVGLVGRNGAGKSSLLKMIAGIYEPDEGRIEAPSGTRIGYLAQEAPGGSATPFETVLATAEERAALLDEAEHATDPHRIAEIHERLNAIDAHGGALAGGAHSRGARLSGGGPAPPARRVLRRLAHAGGARGAAVLRARPAAAGRALEPSRSRGGAVARVVSQGLPGEPDRGEP